jgi:hypothetical protein
MITAAPPGSSAAIAPRRARDARCDRRAASDADSHASICRFCAPGATNDRPTGHLLQEVHGSTAAKACRPVLAVVACTSCTSVPHVGTDAFPRVDFPTGNVRASTTRGGADIGAIRGEGFVADNVRTSRTAKLAQARAFTPQARAFTPQALSPMNRSPSSGACGAATVRFDPESFRRRKSRRP